MSLFYLVKDSVLVALFLVKKKDKERQITLKSNWRLINKYNKKDINILIGLGYILLYMRYYVLLCSYKNNQNNLLSTNNFRMVYIVTINFRR